MTTATGSAAQTPVRAIVTISASILLTSFVAATYGFGLYLFAQLVPDMRADLHFGYSAVGTITAAAQCGFLAFALAGGWLSPRIGGARVVVGSVFICAVCLLLLPLSRDIRITGALLTVLGGAAASVYVPMVELVSRVTRVADRGKVLGLVSSGTSYGVLVNSLLVPVFIGSKNWRGVWFTVGGITLLLAMMGTAVFRRQGLLARRHNSPVDSRPGRAVASAPKLRKDGVAPWIVLVWVMTFLNGFSTLPFQNYLSPYLREERGFDVAFAANVWGLIGIIGMVAGFMVGWLSDRVGVRAALFLSYCCVLLAAVLLVASPVGMMPLVSGILFALAFYPIFGLIPAYVSKVTDGPKATGIFAIANVTLGIGGIVGNYLSGTLKNTTGSFVDIYLAIAITAASLAILSALLPAERRQTIGP